MTEAYVIGTLAKDSQTDILAKRATASINNWDTLENELEVKYQVPADHEYIITKLFCHGTVANQNIYIGYADTVEDDEVGPPTNPKYILNPLKILVANITYEFDVFCRIPAGKYPFARGVGGTCALHVIGYERSTA